MILSAFPFCFTFKFNFLKRETEKQNTYTYTKEKRGALRRLYQPVLNFPFVTEIFTCKPKIDIEETKKQRLNTFNSKLIRDLIFFYRKVPVFSKMETLKSIFTFIPNFTFKSAISKRKSELLEEATNVLALKEFADLYRIKTPVVNRILVTYATKDVKAIKTIQQIHNSQNDYCTSEITKIEPIVFENVNRSSLMESPRLFKYFSAFKRLNKCLSVFHKFVSIMQFLFMETRKRHSWFSFHLR